jgi:hypothetical protein
MSAEHTWATEGRRVQQQTSLSSMIQFAVCEPLRFFRQLDVYGAVDRVLQDDKGCAQSIVPFALGRPASESADMRAELR